MARNLNEIIHLLYQSESRDLHAPHKSDDVVWVAPAVPADIPADHALNVAGVGAHVASLETMQAVQAHNPESLWSVWRAPNLAAQSPTLAGFYAFLHLTQPGHEALAARTLDTHDLDPRFSGFGLAELGRAPTGCRYSWPNAPESKYFQLRYREPLHSV